MIRSLIIRSLITAAVVGLSGTSASGQQAEGNVQPAAQSKATMPDKAELLRRIAVSEAAIQQAEATHADAASRVKIYLHLGGMYEDAGLYLKSEDALQRAESLLRNGPPEKLADTFGYLAVLHVLMGEPQQAEKEQLEALSIRERLGDPVGIAESWSDLADFYVKQRQFKKAVAYARKAMTALGNNPKADARDRVAVRETLAMALCGGKQCGQAVTMMKDAIEVAKAGFGADSLQVGTSYYLLGYVAWKSGDMDGAAEWMGQGTARMRIDLGWGHVVYVNAMRQYAQFLRERGQMEAAATADDEVHKAEAVVDARSLSGRPAGVAALR